MSYPRHLQLLRNAAEHMESELKREFRVHHFRNWDHEVQAFASENGIPFRALQRDGRRLTISAVAEVGLTQDYRFTFARYLSDPTILHRALVFLVRDSHGLWIDPAAFVPAVNKAALLVGATGLLGSHHLENRGAKRGLRV